MCMNLIWSHTLFVSRVLWWVHFFVFIWFLFCIIELCRIKEIISFALHNDQNVDDFNVTSPEYVLVRWHTIAVIITKPNGTIIFLLFVCSFYNVVTDTYQSEGYEAIYITDDITISLLFQHPLGLVVSLLWVLVMVE